MSQRPEVFQGSLDIRIKHQERMLSQAEQESIFHCCVVKKNNVKLEQQL